MRVTSTRPSFFHGRIYRPGEEFDLPEGSIPSKAMTVVGEESKAEKIVDEKPVGRQQRRRKVPVDPQTLSEASALFEDEIPKA
jgi:hypothetical protein